jgi:hypothetical protein
MLRMAIAALVTLACVSAASSEEVAVSVPGQLRLALAGKLLRAPQMSPIIKVVKCGNIECQYGCCQNPRTGSYYCASAHAPLC